MTRRPAQPEASAVWSFRRPPAARVASQPRDLRGHAFYCASAPDAPSNKPPDSQTGWDGLDDHAAKLV
jgi:hypothetical protein